MFRKPKFSGRFLTLAFVPAVLSICACGILQRGTAEIPDVVFMPGEVLALADSLEHALEIAAEYDLELLSFSLGVAVFRARCPEALVAQSGERRAKGIPGTDFSLNLVFHIPDGDI